MGTAVEAEVPAKTAEGTRKEPISSPPRDVETVDLTGDASPAAPTAQPSSNGADAPAPQTNHTESSNPAAEQQEAGTSAAPPPPRVRTGTKRPAADQDPSTSSAPSSSAGPDVESPPKKARATKATSTTAAKKKAAPLSAERFSAALGAIMSANGSIAHTSSVAKLKDIADHAGTWGQRVAILTTLTRSPAAVQAEFVSQAGLLTLQRWFKDAVDGDREQSLESLLAALDKIPITLAALQKPCELGKLVGNLRKDPKFPKLQNTAKVIVDKWKKAVNVAPAAPTVASAAAAAAAATDKATAAAAEVKAAAAKAAAAAATKTTSAAAAPSAAQPQKRRLGEDADLFGAADKRRKDAATAKQQQQHAEAAKPATPAAVKPAAAAAAKAPPPGPAVPSTAGAPKSKSSSSLFGGPSSSSLFSSGSSLGPAPLMTGQARAAQRARDAAARVPSPPPPDRSKPKAKKVKWVEDGSLEAVRWFLRADPPSAAQRDADENTAAAAAPPSPPRFASAAKKEHLLEAQALRSHREAENVSRAELIERLAAMKTEIKWTPPPLLAMPNLKHAVAQGEESTEVAAGPARRARCPPAVYATPDAIPPCPAEPQDPRDRGLYPSTEPPRRIPLAQVAQQAPPPQQAPPAIPGYGPPPPQQQIPGYGPPPPQQQQHGYASYGHPPQQQHQVPGYAPAPGPYGAPPPPLQQQHAPLPPGYGAAPAPGGAPAALPDAAALSQLSQLLSSGVLQTGAPPPAPHQQPMAPTAPPAYPGGPPPPHGHAGHYAPPAPHHQPPPQGRHYQPPPAAGAPLPQPAHLQPRDRAPRPHMPKLPPGMRPMLGLHGRPQQGPPPQPPPQQQAPAPAPGSYAAPPQPGAPHPGPAVFHPGIGKVLEHRGKSRTPCRHFFTPAGCKMGDSCRFSHEPGAGGGRGYGGRY